MVGRIQTDGSMRHLVTWLDWRTRGGQGWKAHVNSSTSWKGSDHRELRWPKSFELESFLENFILLSLGNKGIEKKGALS